MEKIKVCCNVCACCHNIDGCECSKGKITVTNDKDCETAHFCQDYEE